MPELFNFLTTVFLALWLVSFLSGQLTFRDEFFFSVFMMLFMVFSPMGVFLYHTLVFGFSITPYRLRKQPFLIAPRRWGRFARRNVCDSATEIPYWWRKICPESGRKRWLDDGVVTVTTAKRNCDKRIKFYLLLYCITAGSNISAAFSCQWINIRDVVARWKKKIIRVYSNKRLISAKMLVWEGGDEGLIRRWLLSSTFNESWLYFDLIFRLQKLYTRGHMNKGR